MRKMIYSGLHQKSLASLIALLLTNNIAGAAPPEQILDTVVVTAKRIPTPISAANANINVVSRKDIERNHYANLTEALRNVPGISVSNYGNGIGFEQYNELLLNGSDKYVVLVDGIRANMNGSPFSFFSFNAFPMDTVEKIEILKGAASTLYGADAKGGVISIVTRQPQQAKTTLTLEGGSFNTESYRLHHEGRDGQYAWSVDGMTGLTGDYTDGNGRKTPTHGDTRTGGFKLTRTLEPDSDLTFFYNIYQADYNYTIFNAASSRMRTDDMFSEPTANISDLKPFTKYMRASIDNSNMGVTYRKKISDRAENRLSFYRNRTNSAYDIHISTNPFLVNVETTGLSNQYTNRLSDRHTLVGGFDYYQDKIKNFQDMQSSYGGKKIINTSLYLQDDWAISQKINLTGGVRFDDNSYAGNQLTSNLTLGYKQTPATSYYIGYREHFVSPNQYQLFSPRGSTALSPETGSTYEAGVMHKFNPSTAVKATVFRRNSTDTIIYNAALQNYENLGKETAEGWDIQFTKRLTPAWQFFATFTQTEVESQRQDGTTKLRSSIPKKEITLTLNYQKDDWDIALRGHGIIGRHGQPYLYAENTYWLWSSAFNYKITPSAKAFFKINNIFDQFYSEATNAMDLPWEDWYSAPGRNYQFGIVYTM